jgi:hypothetical protein
MGTELDYKHLPAYKYIPFFIRLIFGFTFVFVVALTTLMGFAAIYYHDWKLGILAFFIFVMEALSFADLLKD